MLVPDLFFRFFLPAQDHAETTATTAKPIMPTIPTTKKIYPVGTDIPSLFEPSTGTEPVDRTLLITRAIQQHRYLRIGVLQQLPR